ncbi:MAG: peptidoglycan DD-metalloendopeptidase family protein [Sulfurifustaceae bacterium]
MSACAARTVAPVEERSAPVRQPETEYREVRAGDTLYSIAWESGRDYRDLAAWNNLPTPYVIKPGQKLRLYPPRGGINHKTKTNGASYRIVARGETVHGIAHSTGVRDQDLIAWNSLKPPYALTPGQRLRLTPPEQRVATLKLRDSTTKTTNTSTSATTTHRAEADDHDAIAWVWPTEGAVAVRFAPNNGAKGIDISGSAGQAIRAAAAGKVVYQGSGLRGYGQLIIIKHNADFLSAYAHCAAIYVQEGSVIKAGQKIAAMGSSGTERTKLHFEIRRRGTPVDPLGFLPKK